MNEMTASQEEAYQVYPIGSILREAGRIRLEISEPFRPALMQLDHFSHVMVFWWADRFDNEEARTNLQCRPPYAEDHLTGVFATRSPYRPNPIAMTTCRLVAIDEANGVIEVADIDAYDGTRVVDVKAYFPVCDRVQDANVPDWLSDWPEWMPDDGLGLEPWEE